MVKLVQADSKANHLNNHVLQLWWEEKQLKSYSMPNLKA